MRLSDLLVRIADRLYPRWIEPMISRPTFRYALCGGITYLILDPTFYFIAYHYVVAYQYIDLGWIVISPHIFSLALIFPLTFLISFWLNRHVAFRYSPLRTRVQLFRYALSIAGSVVLTYAGMKFFVEWCGCWPTPSKIITTLITTLYNYIAAKYFSFRNAENQ